MCEDISCNKPIIFELEDESNLNSSSNVIDFILYLIFFIYNIKYIKPIEH